ncbi:carboxypeptidase-like regulatory domain-containing protein [Flaviaesturariibacter aridisoli]|nr:carboxypeptidase-like regulatory domain-containing protein [Flaviaesturariibacter aridisoli]
MNKDELAQVKTHGVTYEFLKATEATIRTVARLLEATGEYRLMQQQLAEVRDELAGSGGGDSLTKAGNRKTVHTFHLQVASAVAAWANGKKDPVLEQQMHVTESKLKAIREADLAPASRAVLEAARTRLANLADYGISSDLLDAFDTAIKTFEKAIPAPRKTQAQRRQLEAKAEARLEALNDFARKQLDKLMVPFKTSHPDFYAGYQRSRTIVDAATRGTALRVQVRDARTDAPIAGAKLILGSLEVETDAQGRFTLKDIEPGTHTVKIGKQGYGERMVEGVEVKVGKVRSLKITL